MRLSLSAAALYARTPLCGSPPAGARPRRRSAPNDRALGGGVGLLGLGAQPSQLRPGLLELGAQPSEHSAGLLELAASRVRRPHACIW